MFTVVKVRADQKRGDYKDPGWYTQPPGTQAFEWTGALPEPARFRTEGGQSMPVAVKPTRAVELRARKPAGHSGH
jgi:hypothetical protein